MDSVKTILDYIGYASTIVLLLLFIAGVITWFKGILPALIRLGNGLAKRKIAIFAKADNLSNLKNILNDSKLFDKKNILDISTTADLGRAEKATLFLVFWHDWQNEIDDILRLKEDGTALLVYAPQEQGLIPRESMTKLSERRNTVVTNFRGRLLNDIVTSMISTSYEK